MDPSTPTNIPNPDYVSVPFEFSEWTLDNGLVLWKEIGRMGDKMFLEGGTEKKDMFGRPWRTLYREIIVNSKFAPAEWRGEWEGKVSSQSPREPVTSIDEILANIENQVKALAAVELPLPGEDISLTHSECVEALSDAMKVIECVGTTGIYRKLEAAQTWMKKYFPNRV